MCKNATEILQKNGQQNVSRISAIFFTWDTCRKDYFMPACRYTVVEDVLINQQYLQYCMNKIIPFF